MNLDGGDSGVAISGSWRLKSTLGMEVGALSCPCGEPLKITARWHETSLDQGVGAPGPDARADGGDGALIETRSAEPKEWQVQVRGRGRHPEPGGERIRLRVD